MNKQQTKSQWFSMSSKFAGICVECNGVIEKNESILWNKENGAKHKNCPEINITKPKKSKDWIDPKKYLYKELLGRNNCQCCGIDVSDKSKRYIDDDRLVCVDCFGN